MKLGRIEIKGFKSIREMDLQLSNLNVLIGANGAGKTNFIAAFKLLNQIVEERLQLHVGQSGGANVLLYLGQKTTIEIALHLHFEASQYEVKLFPAAADTLVLAEEKIEFADHFFSIRSGSKETNLRQAPFDSIVQHELINMFNWQIYHFHDTSDSAKMKQTGDIGDNAALRPDASNLAAFLYLLKEMHRPYYDNIVRTIRLAAPFFEDFILRPSPLNPAKILLEWRQKGTDAYFNAHTLSDGTLRFICLTTLLMQPTLPSTVLIDEPELGLHPYAITLLASLIQSAAQKTQVIISTQSVPLVNQFAPEAIIVVDREDNQSVFRRLSKPEIESWMEDYGLGELWEKNVLGGGPR